jgi:hypothetical protein
VTFNDGYAHNHEFALPTLVRHGVSATFFVTAGFLKRDAVVLARFRALRRVSDEMIQPLSWSQIDEMRASGLDVGPHTYAHPNLARLDDQHLALELTRLKRVLADRTGTSVSMMAYPFGRPKVHVDDRVVKAVRGSGYALAASTATRGLRLRDDPLIPRFFATKDFVSVLREKILGESDLIGIVRERTPKAVARFVSPRDSHSELARDDSDTSRANEQHARGPRSHSHGQRRDARLQRRAVHRGGARLDPRTELRRPRARDLRQRLHRSNP